MQYAAVVFGKNMAENLKLALDSLLAQTLEPRKIIVLDDGSTDKTKEILSSYVVHYSEVIDAICFREAKYDLRRIPFLLNHAIQRVETLEPSPDYILIGADDDIYPRKYAQTLIEQTEVDQSLVISSGSVQGVSSLRAKNPPPEGGGRLIRFSFLKTVGGRFPTFYGYESWILYKALQMGLKIKKFPEAKIVHARALGRTHGFREWGLAMACADFHPLYVLLVAISNLLFNWKFIPPRAVFRMTADYFLAFRVGSKTDPALKRWRETDPTIVEWLRRDQVARVTRLLSSPLRLLIGLLMRGSLAEGQS